MVHPHWTYKKLNLSYSLMEELSSLIIEGATEKVSLFTEVNLQQKL